VPEEQQLAAPTGRDKLDHASSSSDVHLHVYLLQGCPLVATSPMHFALPADDRDHRFVAILLDTFAAPLTSVPRPSSGEAANTNQQQQQLQQKERQQQPCKSTASQQPPTTLDVGQHPTPHLHRPYLRAVGATPSYYRQLGTACGGRSPSAEILPALDIFPAPAHTARPYHSHIPELFILDRAHFHSSDDGMAIELALVSGVETQFITTDNSSAPTATAQWVPGCHPQCVAFVPHNIAPAAPLSTHLPELVDMDSDDPCAAVNDILAAQADCIPGICSVVEEEEDVGESGAKRAFDAATAAALMSIRPASPLDGFALDPFTLLVHYRTVITSEDAYYDCGLNVRLVGNSAMAPATEKYPDRSVADLAGAAAIFTVELGLLTDQEIDRGLKITPVSCRTGVPRGPTAVWRPSIGKSAVLAEGQRQLLAPDQADINFYYHRFDDFKDWEDWELHVWTEATETEPVQATVVFPTSPYCLPSSIACSASIPREQEGLVLFRLLSAFGFSRDATMHVQPIKMNTVPGHCFEDPYSGEFVQEPSHRETGMKDIVRKWTRSKFRTNTIHIIQANSELQAEFPSRSSIVARRYVDLRYARYDSNDVSEWDLWTWDSADAPSTRHALAPESISNLTENRRMLVSPHYEFHFVIDRAAYGAGSSIFVLPRRGGDTWVEKDHPARLISRNWVIADCDALARPRVYIVQASPVVFRDLKDAKNMLDADVEGLHFIMVRSPVPFDWIQSEMKSDSVPNVFLLNQCASEALAAVSGTDANLKNLRNSTIIKCGNIERVSPVAFRCSIPMKLDEDFLVENIAVSLPGFSPCDVHWRRHDNFDKYYYSGSLGWDYTPTACMFRCFAPAADIVYVVLYGTPYGGDREQMPMRRIPEGCWKVTIHRNLKGIYYKLLAEGRDKLLFPGVEVIDPYSRCNTSHNGRGLIFGWESTPIAPRPNIKPEQAIIYELHIRDATIDIASGVQNRGKYVGLTETGTYIQTDATRRSTCTAIEDSEKRPSSESEQDGRNQSVKPGKGRLVTGQTSDISGIRDASFRDDREAVAETTPDKTRVATALDHILEMGVTAVQIMPIQDFDNDETDSTAYRWGYMPVHFNSPDGWYATETSTVARVTEFKLLVDTLHRVGLKVILDVVYNHTAEDGNELNLKARFSFNGLAPRYFYRNCTNTPVAHTGESTCAIGPGPTGQNCGRCVSNGSGCGNEFRSEAPMGRKFIIDSLKYWVNEYKVDGFRFDLLGLIDVDTLSLAAKELHAIDPNIMLYGEPWCGGLTPIRSTEKGMQRSRGFGVFNNTFRDALRGSPFGIEETFVMDGGRIDQVKRGIIGSIDDFADSPMESINYVECHDNYTLWDHMQFYIGLRSDDIKFSETDCERIHRFSAAILFTSQGIPMMQIGQEMCRTKFGEENSYQSPDSVNMVRWDGKRDRLSTVAYYKGLIALRRGHPELLSMTDASVIRSHITFYEDLHLAVPRRCIAYRIRSGNHYEKTAGSSACAQLIETEEVGIECNEQWQAVVILLNPNPTSSSFVLPGADVFQHWIQVVDALTAGVHPIGTPFYGSIDVPGRSAAVLRQASSAENGSCLLNCRLDCITDAFCTPADEVRSLYAVGLSLERTVDEQAAYEVLVRRREEFLSEQTNASA
jgi:pullulanase